MAETRGLNVIQGQRPQIEVPSIMQEMTDIIEDVNQYTWDSGNGMNWGMQSLNEAFEGLNSGLHVVGGQPNVGKSSLCMQMAWSIAKSNQQPTATCKNIAYVLYISLDDTVRYILPRVVACEKKIPINVVKMPQKYRNSPEGLTLLTKREDGLRMLKQNIKHFKIVDQANVPGIEDIETISSEIDRHNTKLKEINEDYKLVVVIDNLHDVESSAINFKGDEKAKYTYIATELNHLCNTYDIPIICTAEFRKLNGPRRPTMDDIKEANKIAYKAQATILCYNDVGLKGESANVYWQKDGSPAKQPVLEAFVGKNKLSDFKKRIFFEFMPELAYCKEATPQATIRYNQMIMG